MAGIITNLSWGRFQCSNGYIDIHSVTGGPSYQVSEEFPHGCFEVHLYFYDGYDTFERGGPNAPVDDASLTSFKIPYINGSDPIEAALVVLQQVYPQSVVVH